jgi:transcriptional regulator with XRE-family HTH domain
MPEVTYIGPGGRRPLLRALVGEVLRRNRLGQRRTLADVARAARVSVPYLSEVERGRKEASSEVLAAVCDALRIDLTDLLAEVGRDLVEGRAAATRAEGRAAAFRLEAARRRFTVPPPARRSGDAVLLAA